MFKAKKGALAIEELAGVLIVMFVAVIVIFSFYIINVFNKSQKQKVVEVSFKDLNAGYNLDYFLRSEINGKYVSDLVNEAYLSDNYEQLRAASNKFFKSIYYSEGSGHELIIDGKSIDFTYIFTGKTKSISQIPVMDGRVVNVELSIGRSVDLTSAT